MKYKIATGLAAILAVTFIISAIGCARIASSEARRDGSATGAKDVGNDVTFVPLESDPAASANVTDALISAEKAKPAPAFIEGKWINTEPLKAEDLRGRVVLIEFWTFGCYNCINTLPAIKGSDSRYRSKGLTVIGIETPETAAERSFDNLTAAVKKRGIEYPVLTDYENANWNAFKVEAWPTIFILDKQGRVRYTHIGEGAYDTQDSVIQTLLAESNAKAAITSVASDDVFDGVEVAKTEAEWKKSLTPEQYYILREAGTERAYTGEYAETHDDGDYYCAACHLKLFNSKTKFESGTGWPSFYEPVNKKNVIEKTDTSFGITRTEVLCARCHGHLGHVFDDGPKPTGLRYCMNSAALKFEKK